MNDGLSEKNAFLLEKSNREKTVVECNEDMNI